MNGISTLPPDRPQSFPVPGLPRVGVRVAPCVAALGLAGVVWSLMGMSLDRSGTAAAAAHNARAVWPYWIASGVCWVGLTFIWLGLRHRPLQPSGATGWLAIVGLAVAARVVVLVGHQPTLSDDVYRYVFDGRNLAQGLNPYLTDPAARLAALESGAPENWTDEHATLHLLAYPEITTPYLPCSQYVFALLGRACEWGGWTSPQDSAQVFRCAFTIVEIALLLVVASVLRRRELSHWWLALYAWHPLPIDAFAASGHQDILGIVFMALALALVAGGVARVGRAAGAVAWSIALAAAVMVKPVAALAGLMVLRRERPRAWITSILVGSIISIAFALPLDWRPGTPAFEAWRSTADWMAEKAAHFGGLYEPILCVVRHVMPDGPHRQPGFNLEQEWLARKLSMGALVAAILMIWWRSRDAWCATAAALLLLTLASTTCHPWYLMWAFALFPIARGGWTLWVYSLTISFGYVVFVSGKGHALGVEWTVAPWALALAYIPLAITLPIDMVSMFRPARPSTQH